MNKSYTVPEQYHGATLRAFLRSGCGLSASLVRSVKFLPDGITRDGVKINTDAVLSCGDVIILRFPPDIPNLVEQPEIPFSVIIDNEDFVVADKGAGIAVHPTLNYPSGTVANAFAAWANERGEQLLFRPVYRLDKDTSGCLLVAKNRIAAKALAQSCKKKYVAIVRGVPGQPQGSVTLPIALAEDSIIKRRCAPDGQSAETQYRTLDNANGYSLLELTLVTGRTHQIRVHMSSVGLPLLGDRLYSEPSLLIARQALHCAHISFSLDGTQHFQAVSPFPADMEAAATECGLKLPLY